MKGALREKKKHEGTIVPYISQETLELIKIGIKFVFRDSITKKLGPSKI